MSMRLLLPLLLVMMSLTSTPSSTTSTRISALGSSGLLPLPACAMV
jgi:hypothetical protein